jgi:hypothetical protein
VSGIAEGPLRAITGCELSQQSSLPYSISSARASSVGGISTPRTLAVLMLITNSYLPDTQFIAAKVSTTLRLLNPIMPMPG